MRISLGLSAKIILIGGGALAALLAIGILAVSRVAEDRVLDLSRESGRTLSREIAQEAARNLSLDLSIARGIAGTMETLKAQGVSSRATYDAVLERNFTEHPDLLAVWAADCRHLNNFWSCARSTSFHASTKALDSSGESTALARCLMASFASVVGMRSSSSVTPG